MADRKTNTLTVWIIVIGWAGLSLILNIRGLFIDQLEKPPLALLLSVTGPPILFLIAYSLSTKVRSVSLNLDLRLLTAMQGWRVIGAMFLVLMSFRLLPGTFAWPAGIGDLIVGMYAPFVVVAISRQTPGWSKHVVGGGVLSGRSPIGILRVEVPTDIMQQLPLSFIPTFAVPFWIVLHIISLLKLRNLQAGD